MTNLTINGRFSQVGKFRQLTSVHQNSKYNKKTLAAEVEINIENVVNPHVT